MLLSNVRGSDMRLERLPVSLKTNAFGELLKLPLDQMSAPARRKTLGHKPGVEPTEQTPACEETPQPMFERFEVRR
jgi:hypothetical protein